MDLAAKINLPLAPLDNPDKAFILKQRGVILGIELNAETSKWCIPTDKVHRNRRIFMDVAKQQFID